MKKEENVFTDVAVKDIVSETNRKIGGMGNIDILAEDIKQNGLTNPPTVVETEDGKYQVVAGRRRIEAVRQLKWKTVMVKIIAGNEDRLASIALSENVNRMEMHPLDEAEHFKRLLEKGTDIKDIAATFDRTVAGIHHRVRLCDLTESIKQMFRDEKLTLTSAALLSSLPADDQEKFFKKNGEKQKVDTYEVNIFMHQVQHCTLKDIADKECAKCKKRTHNTVPGLFDDFRSLEDVCFDGECYARKWQALIAGLITKHDDFLRTDTNVIIDRSIPDFLPKKTKTVSLDGTEFTLLAPGKYQWSETKQKAKSSTAWLVEKLWGANDVSVKRVKFSIYERPNYNYQRPPEDPVKEYLIDQVSDIPQESQKAVAEKVKEQYGWRGNLKQEIRAKLLKALVSKRLKEESRENLAALYLRGVCEGTDDNGNTMDFEDEGDREIFNAIFGPEGITKFEEIPEEPLAEKLFLFLFAAGMKPNHLPDIDDSEEKWVDTERSMRWKFLQIARDEYTMMYRELLSAAVKEVVSRLEEPTIEGGEEETEDAEAEYADAEE
jgi:ParB/RepB/Spo0J family partition protein